MNDLLQERIDFYKANGADVLADLISDAYNEIFVTEQMINTCGDPYKEIDYAYKMIINMKRANDSIVCLEDKWNIYSKVTEYLWDYYLGVFHNLAKLFGYSEQSYILELDQMIETDKIEKENLKPNEVIKKIALDADVSEYHLLQREVQSIKNDVNSMSKKLEKLTERLENFFSE